MGEEGPLRGGLQRGPCRVLGTPTLRLGCSSCRFSWPGHGGLFPRKVSAASSSLLLSILSAQHLDYATLQLRCVHRDT